MINKSNIFKGKQTIGPTDERVITMNLVWRTNNSTNEPTVQQLYQLIRFLTFHVPLIHFYRF